MWPAGSQGVLAGDGVRIRDGKGRKIGEGLCHPLEMTAERERGPQQVICHRVGVRVGDWRNEGQGEDPPLAYLLPWPASGHFLN